MAVGPTGPMMPPPDAPPPVDNAETLAQVITAETGGTQVPRDPPDPPERRSALVRAWAKRVKAAKSHWKSAFDRMAEDEDFCFGKQ